jgi:hypothetical protein
MSSNLKRDEIPPLQAQNWRMNFKEEKSLTFNLVIPQIILQKETYRKLAGENENRIRIYLGLEDSGEGGIYRLCAFAVSAFLLGSGDVYVDYETPVFKLAKNNEDYSSKIPDVLEKIKLYRSWRTGETDDNVEGAAFRKYIYPNAYLFTKSELQEIFNVQNKSEAQIEFGISKTMNVMIYPEVAENREVDDKTIVFDNAGSCPPFCGEGSIYNF